MVLAIKAIKNTIRTFIPHSGEEYILKFLHDIELADLNRGISMKTLKGTIRSIKLIMYLELDRIFPDKNIDRKCYIVKKLKLLQDGITKDIQQYGRMV